MIRLFQHLPSGDDILDRVQRNVEEAFRKLVKLTPILDGRLVTGVSVATTNTRVEHGLGRKPLGWIVVGKTADSRIWDSQASELLPDRYLALTASAAVTASIWIF